MKKLNEAAQMQANGGKASKNCNKRVTAVTHTTKPNSFSGSSNRGSSNRGSGGSSSNNRGGSNSCIKKTPTRRR